MNDRRVPLDLTVPCKLWAGDSANGYGRLVVDGQEKYVHRLAYQLHVGPIPRGWEIDHVCHSEAVALGTCDGGQCEHRLCWESAHLEIVTSAENSRRGNHPMFAIARSDTCGRGHDLTDEANVYTRADGRRRCRVCSTMTQQERRSRP